VCQLEELIAIRHCIFLLGSSGVGKSEVYKTLARSWTATGQKTTVQDLLAIYSIVCFKFGSTLQGLNPVTSCSRNITYRF
jgi:hypothetical protein